MIQKPFREADLARGIQRALDAATTFVRPSPLAPIGKFRACAGGYLIPISSIGIQYGRTAQRILAGATAMNPVTAFLTTSIGLVGLGLSWAVAPIAGAPLLILAMLIGVLGGSGLGDRPYLGRRSGVTDR
jgi:hypothetical protein